MQMPIIDAEVINTSFTILVMVATCSAVFVSSNARKHARSLGDSQFGELEESLRKMIERAEDAGARLSHQLRLEKDELNRLLTALLDAKASAQQSTHVKRSQTQSKSNPQSTSKTGAARRGFDDNDEDLPNETWLTTPQILKTGVRHAHDKLSAMAEDRDDHIQLSKESLELVNKRLGQREPANMSKPQPSPKVSEEMARRMTGKYQTEDVRISEASLREKIEVVKDSANRVSPAYSSNPDVSSYGAAYNIARRLLREGKAPEAIAKKLDLQLNEVLMLASIDDDQETPKQYATSRAVGR